MNPWYGRNLAANVFAFQVYGLTPPVAIAWLSFRADYIEHIIEVPHDIWEIFQNIMQGLVVWLVAAFFLAIFASTRFDALRINRQVSSNRRRREAIANRTRPFLSRR